MIGVEMEQQIDDRRPGVKTLRFEHVAADAEGLGVFIPSDLRGAIEDANVP